MRLRRKSRYVRQGQFLHKDIYKENWAAIIFNACFHHCHDHLKLLDIIFNSSPDVVLYLLGESIYQNHPWPWGVNLEGQAIYCIHKFGWLELAFDEDYFLNLVRDRDCYAQVFRAPYDAKISLYKIAKLRRDAKGSSSIFPRDTHEVKFLKKSFVEEGNNMVPGRWTGGQVSFSLSHLPALNLGIRFRNYKPKNTAISVNTSSGSTSVQLGPGEEWFFRCARPEFSEIEILSTVDNPLRQGWSADDRDLGIHIDSFVVDPT